MAVSIKKMLLVGSLILLVSLFYRGCREKSEIEKLVYSAVNDPDLVHARQALEELDHQPMTARVAREAKRSYIRLKAVEKLIPGPWQDLLLHLAREDPSKHVRLTALKKIQSQEILARFARQDPDWGIRAAAVKKLIPSRWHLLLDNLAREDKSTYVRLSCHAHLGDQKTLLEFARIHPNIYVRRYAIHLLTDLSALTWFKNNDPVPDIRSAAEKRIRLVLIQSAALAVSFVIN